jgi:xylulokinase
VSLTNGEPIAIGVDLGTSSLKVVAVAADGRVVARAAHGYRTTRHEPGSAEQNPGDWLEACDLAIAALGRIIDPARWSAIGLSGMLPTLVSLDDELHVVGPALTWEDGRAEADAERMLAQLGTATVYRTTGQRLDGRYLLPMHARRSSEYPDATRVLGAKDYLLLSLTGRLATDPSTATGYGCFDLDSGAWDGAISATAGSPVMPDVVPSSTVFPLLAMHAERWGCAPGLPVVVGAADSVMGAYGLGITSPGRIGVIAGTSTVVIGWSGIARPDQESRYLVTPLAGDGYGLELDLMSTGSAVAWLAELLGLGGRQDELVELAATADLESRRAGRPRGPDADGRHRRAHAADITGRVGEGAPGRDRAGGVSLRRRAPGG